MDATRGVLKTSAAGFARRENEGAHEGTLGKRQFSCFRSSGLCSRALETRTEQRGCTHESACHGHGIIDLASLRSQDGARSVFAEPDSQSPSTSAVIYSASRIGKGMVGGGRETRISLQTRDHFPVAYISVLHPTASSPFRRCSPWVLAGGMRDGEGLNGG